MSQPSESAAPSGHANRQAVLYCPYCAEETLFPLEEGGWECRSCLRAFTVRFLGLRPARGHGEQAQP
jgi:ribosomal protein L37AE/L43A